MEHEAKQTAAVTRSQNAMYLLPHDTAAAEEFLAPLLQRVDPEDPALQLLVITSDADVAGALAATLVPLRDASALRVVPVAGPRRAERRVREGAHVVLGAASDLLALVRSSALKLESVRGVAVAWADELAGANVDALEALFAEVPKTAARVLVATEATDSVEALIERYARRARRNVAGADDETPPVNVGYVTAAAAGRAAALRRVIDGLDPVTARVVVRTDDSERAARQALAAMGHHGSYAAITVARGDQEDESSAGDVDLAVIFDLPASAASLAAAAAGAKRAVALVQPRQLPSLRTLARGGTVSPVSLPDVASRGQAELSALRQALVAELRGGSIARELLVLEPLLEEHDPIELAAAALRLTTRAGAGAGQVAASAGAAAAPSGPMTRIFVNVGEMDNARPGDLVGAIINEGGLQRDQVGRVELRDKHAVVEVASDAAEQVIERLSGASIRGRRVQARLDQDRAARGDRPERGERPERGARPARPARDGEDRPRSRPAARERSFDRDRPPRERSFDRDRAPRERSFDRERPPRERSFDRERPPRERSFDRDRAPRDRAPERPARDRSFGPRSRDGGGRDTGPRGASRPPRPRRGDS